MPTRFSFEGKTDIASIVVEPRDGGLYRVCIERIDKPEYSHMVICGLKMACAIASRWCRDAFNRAIKHYNNTHTYDLPAIYKDYEHGR